MILLDTDTFTLHQHGHAPLTRRFDRLLGTKGVKRIGRVDLLIASIALANKAVLVTRNLKDFEKVPGLQLANWAD